MQYIDRILDGQSIAKKIEMYEIGVVSPYRHQCSRITKECRRKGYNDIAVGTAEFFQGQEKKVMIISTVRTDNGLGFVKDERVSSLKKIYIKHFS